MKKQLLFLTALLLAGTASLATAPQQPAPTVEAARQIARPTATASRVDIGQIHCSGRSYLIRAFLEFDEATQDFTNVHSLHIETPLGEYSLGVSSYKWWITRAGEFSTLYVEVRYSGACSGIYTSMIPYGGGILPNPDLFSTEE